MVNVENGKQKAQEQADEKVFLAFGLCRPRTPCQSFSGRLSATKSNRDHFAKRWPSSPSTEFSKI
jgi:hypothetical protein